MHTTYHSIARQEELLADGALLRVSRGFLAQHLSVGQGQGEGMEGPGIGQGGTATCLRSA